MLEKGHSSRGLFLELGLMLEVSVAQDDLFIGYRARPNMATACARGAS